MHLMRSICRLLHHASQPAAPVLNSGACADMAFLHICSRLPGIVVATSIKLLQLCSGSQEAKDARQLHQSAVKAARNQQVVNVIFFPRPVPVQIANDTSPCKCSMCERESQLASQITS